MKKYARKHEHSFVGGQKQFYIFTILLEAMEDNNGKNKAITTSDMTTMLLRISGKPTDFKLEKANTKRALQTYQEWGYVKHLKDDKWCFDWRNYQNTKLMRFYKKNKIRNKTITNRIKWKYQQLLEKGVELKWPLFSYKLEI